MPDVISTITTMLGIIIIDLVLSGDNAVVIGMAARRLPPYQRRRAIIFGGGAAIVLRVTFAAITALLLQIPLLQAIGGVLLLWIAWKLLRDTEQEEHEIKEGGSMAEALRTIILADVVMSLDNILALAGVSHGSVVLLLLGLGLSMPIVLFGSGLVAVVMNRLPWLAYVGAAVLTWTAGQMIAHDPIAGSLLPEVAGVDTLFPAAVTIVVFAISILPLLAKRRDSRQKLTLSSVSGQDVDLSQPATDERKESGQFVPTLDVAGGVNSSSQNDGGDTGQVSKPSIESVRELRNRDMNA